MNTIKIRIEGQLRNQTNYVWNNARLIYIDLLSNIYLTIELRSKIKTLQKELLLLDDAWTYSGIPDKNKTERILNNLRYLLHLISSD